uniref:Protein kinase domain-containing protein n=1 Tax=Oryzias latipes TaxID=8090 RepID=A0A3P9ITB7_ORYLA
MAPEALVGSLTTEKSHVWSLACIAAEMFLGFPFYTAYWDYEMIWNITQTHGHFPDHVLNAGSKTKEFFSKRGTNQWLLKTPREYGKNIPKDVKFFSPEDFGKLHQKSGICSKTEQTDVEHFGDLINNLNVTRKSNLLNNSALPSRNASKNKKNG